MFIMHPLYSSWIFLGFLEFLLSLSFSFLPHTHNSPPSLWDTLSLSVSFPQPLSLKSNLFFYFGTKPERPAPPASGSVTVFVRACVCINSHNLEPACCHKQLWGRQILSQICCGLSLAEPGLLCKSTAFNWFRW